MMTLMAGKRNELLNKREENLHREGFNIKYGEITLQRLSRSAYAQTIWDLWLQG